MSSSIRTLSTYVVATFVALLALTLWPHNTDKLLVFVPAASADGVSASATQDAQYFSITADSDVRLLSKIGRSGYVIAVPDRGGNAVVKQLYRNGAFLVLNAANLDGCGGTENGSAFRRNQT